MVQHVDSPREPLESDAEFLRHVADWMAAMCPGNRCTDDRDRLREIAAKIEEAKSWT